MAPLRIVTMSLVALAASAAFADDLLYRYEGDSFPYDHSAGWVNGNPCEDPCTEAVENGRYVLRWPFAGDRVGFDLTIADPGDPPPPNALGRVALSV